MGADSPEKKSEKKINIELDNSTDIIKSSDMITHKNASDFLATYNKLENRGMVGVGQRDIFSADTKIFKTQEGKYYITKKEGNQTIAYAVIENSALLEAFIASITEKKYNQNLLKELGGEIHDHVMVNILPDAGNNGKETITLSLNKLKREVITFPQLDQKVADLTLQYNELKYHKLKPAIKNAPKEWKNNVIYLNNIKRLLDIANTFKTHIEDISKKMATQRVSLAQDNTPIALAEWKAKLDYIHAQLTSIDRYFLHPDLALTSTLDLSAFNIDTPLYRVKDVQKLLEKVNAQKNEIKKINELQFNVDLSRIDADEQQRFRLYLNDVLNGTIDPSKEPFEEKKKDAFVGLISQYPRLKGYMQDGTSVTGAGIVADKVKENKNTKDNNDADNNIIPGASQEEQQKYSNGLEALAKGGVSGGFGALLDKTHMTAEQKKFRGGMGNLAVTGGLIYVGWKMVSSAFQLIFGKKDDAKNKAAWAWLIAPVLAVGTYQAAFGESPLKILSGGAGSEKIASLFGYKSITGAPDNAGSTGQDGQGQLATKQEVNPDLEKDKETYGGFYKILALFGGRTRREISEMVEKDSDNRIKIKADRYKDMLNAFKYGDKNGKTNPDAAAFLEEIGEKDKNNIMDLVLREGMGITREDLTDPTKQDETIDEIMMEPSMRLAAIAMFMKNNDYDRVAPDKLKYIKEYIREKGATYARLEELNKKNDIFRKGGVEDIDDQTGLASRIKEIAAGDVAREAELLKDINAFYDYRPNAAKEIELLGTRPNIEFKTYGEKVKLNLAKKELVGFTPKGFPTYLELFKAANLTNRIQFICKDKIAVKEKPFYANMITKEILFDDAVFASTDFDTRIISGRLRGALDELSPLLRENRTAYCEYLNGLRNWTIAKPEPIVQKPAETIPQAPAEIRRKFEALTTNAVTKAAILSGVDKFYKYRPNADKILTINGSRPTIGFITYGERTEINLAKMTMPGFTPSPFKDYFELFNAAGLTNYIKSVCKEKTTKKGLPFYVGKPGQDIVFNDESTWTLGTDTEMVSAGWGGSLNKISPTLENYKEDYVAYLNTLRDKTGLSAKIKELSKGNKERETKILEGMNLFHDQMKSNRDQKIDLKYINRPNVGFETYGQITDLNMEEKAMKGFTAAAFPDYLELFKAASLTNRIKDLCKDKDADKDPFNISFPGGDIEFNENDKTFDTEILSAGIGGELNDISPRLEDHKDNYIAYLNTWYNKYKRLDQPS